MKDNLRREVTATEAQEILDDEFDGTVTVTDAGVTLSCGEGEILVVPNPSKPGGVIYTYQLTDEEEDKCHETPPVPPASSEQEP